MTDSDCNSGACHKHPGAPESLPGFCVCNASTNAGCADNFICFTPDAVAHAQHMVSVPPLCLIPVGEPCSSSIACLTGNCDKGTNLCACGLETDFPCDTKAGEWCSAQEHSQHPQTHYVCEYQEWDGLPTRGLHEDCRTSDGSYCAPKFEPVRCNDGCMCYNQCHATSAWCYFNEKTCHNMRKHHA